MPTRTGVAVTDFPTYFSPLEKPGAFVGVVISTELPVLDGITPTPGALIRPDTPLVFDITSPNTFVLIIPMVILDPFRAPEPTHDNDKFHPLYNGSTREAIVHATSGDPGFRYSIYRRGGWTSDPVLLLYAVDEFGNMFVGP